MEMWNYIYPIEIIYVICSQRKEFTCANGDLFENGRFVTHRVHSSYI
ncbi:hypothetical protein BN1200_140026 [Klebsiella variicola]|nr:hypothetical protein BN1200_140026 [Klebsiella variicola]